MVFSIPLKAENILLLKIKSHCSPQIVVLPPPKRSGNTITLLKRNTMSQINVYLNFDGKCAEAMKFYQSCLGGELFLQTVKASPMADQWPAHKQDHILHSSLTNGSLLLLASDMGADPSGMINNVSISLTCNTPEEMVAAFEKLSAGGEPLRPVHDFFGGKIGVLRDKYGFNWLLYYNNQ